MADAKQSAVRAFVEEMQQVEGRGWDDAQIERLLGRMAQQARYQVYAWERSDCWPRCHST